MNNSVYMFTKGHNVYRVYIYMIVILSYYNKNILFKKHFKETIVYFINTQMCTYTDKILFLFFSFRFEFIAKI